MMLYSVLLSAGMAGGVAEGEGGLGICTCDEGLVVLHRTLDTHAASSTYALLHAIGPFLDHVKAWRERLRRLTERWSYGSIAARASCALDAQSRMFVVSFLGHLLASWPSGCEANAITMGPTGWSALMEVTEADAEAVQALLNVLHITTSVKGDCVSVSLASTVDREAVEVMKECIESPLDPIPFHPHGTSQRGSRREAPPLILNALIRLVSTWHRGA
jgi:hypothetical protein